MALSTRCSHPARHSDVTPVRRPAGVGQLYLMAVPQTLHLIPTPVTPRAQYCATPGTESAPPRGSGFAYACSATKALAGDGPIAVPHTAARERHQPRPPTRPRLPHPGDAALRRRVPRPGLSGGVGPALDGGGGVTSGDATGSFWGASTGADARSLLVAIAVSHRCRLARHGRFAHSAGRRAGRT